MNVGAHHLEPGDLAPPAVRRTIRADQVQVGMVVTDAANTLVRQRRGRWPVVTAVTTSRAGGRRTVYLELSDRRGTPLALGRADAVTILVDQRR